LINGLCVVINGDQSIHHSHSPLIKSQSIWSQSMEINPFMTRHWTVTWLSVSLLFFSFFFCRWSQSMEINPFMTSHCAVTCLSMACKSQSVTQITVHQVSVHWLWPPIKRNQAKNKFEPPHLVTFLISFRSHCQITVNWLWIIRTWQRGMTHTMNLYHTICCRIPRYRWSCSLSVSQSNHS